MITIDEYQKVCDISIKYEATLVVFQRSDTGEESTVTFKASFPATIDKVAIWANRISNENPVIVTQLSRTFKVAKISLSTVTTKPIVIDMEL